MPRADHAAAPWLAIPRGVLHFIVQIALRALLAITLAALAWPALASGPRWVTGAPYFTANPGNPVLWNVGNIAYFTDPADLSTSVNHAAADALVATAASAWNVPTASITLVQGGTLAEHVSSANSYVSSSGPVFAADVESSNYAAIPIAVLYDSDGYLTDMLLGSGASAPAECRQNGVSEDVDGITPAGQIEHAIVILNGRCTGPAPEQQLQLQYQLERVFGRVLGLGWSQTNDNVFTRAPQPTIVQAQHWPIMHPIDILCGPYTYQCLPSPFTLRDDDVASISGLYPSIAFLPFPTPTPAPGKQWSFIQASRIWGFYNFPTGQGMAGVNMVFHRWRGGTATFEPYEDVSSVSGYLYRQNNGNPVTGADSSMAGSMGASNAILEGNYCFLWIPDDDPEGAVNGNMSGNIASQPVNPLYTGAHAVGPYAQGTVAPSGSAQTQLSPYPVSPFVMYSRAFELDVPTPTDAAANCSTTADGTESSPAAADPSGWWTSVLCAYGHTAWSTLSMRAGRTATVEVTALDESGIATTQKMMPLLGAWASTDATGTLPTLAATPAAFNTLAAGTTATSVVTNSAPQSLRLVIADARGDGRPDFAYRARILYADSVSPAAVSSTGGVITIAGTGFRPGNSVAINGVAAQVAAWTSTTITMIAPPQSTVGAAPNTPVAITVSDLSTGGSTTMSAALVYSSSLAPDLMSLVAAPGGTLAVGAATTFAIRITLSDGVTPVAGLPVSFSFAGPAQIAGCLASPCLHTTDATGLASATITTSTFGAITLSTSALGLMQSASFTAVARSVSAVQPAIYVAAGSAVDWTPQLAVIQNSAPAADLQIDWTPSGGFALSAASTDTGVNGIAQTTASLGPLASGAQTSAQACAWTADATPQLPALCATFTAIAVDPSALHIAVTSGANQTVTSPAAFAPVILQITDPAGHPVAGAQVTLYQRVDALEMPCPGRGPCPIPPVLAASTAAARSDTNGRITVAPAQLAATGEITNLAAATGTQGFVAISLTQLP